jgi:hypothetical protein
VIYILKRQVLDNGAELFGKNPKPLKQGSRSSLDDRTPDEVYYGLPHPFAEAA